VLTARLPGAEYAPLYFRSGGLFSADIMSVYESLTQPVWLSHGVRGNFTDYRGRRWLEARGNWRFAVDLDEFNRHLLGKLEVTAEFR